MIVYEHEDSDGHRLRLLDDDDGEPAAIRCNSSCSVAGSYLEPQQMRDLAAALLKLAGPGSTTYKASEVTVTLGGVEMKDIGDVTHTEIKNEGTAGESLNLSSAVNQPSHYCSHPSGTECIDITEHMNFNLGNAVKYIWRASLKGKQVEDLKKAAWYIAREIARLGQ